MTKSAGTSSNTGTKRSAPAADSTPAATGGKSTAAGTVPPKGQVQRKAWWLPACGYHPLSDQATIAFLKKASDASVMGLVTLSALCATFLLAWGRPGTACIPELAKKAELTEPSWVQVLFASLPFVIFPLTLYVSGLVQAAEKDGHALGAVSTLCFIEVIAAIAIGSGMMVCVTGSQSWLIVTGVMIVLSILTWAFTFKYPNWLRSFIWSKCFRQDETAVSTDVAGGENEALAVVVKQQ